MHRISLLIAALVLVAAPARAEEFLLKDGTKIVGKIVGYEKDAFRVETSFGIAIIYKDKIERIVMTPGSSSPAAGAPKMEPTPRSAPPAEERPSRIEPSGPPVEVVTGTGYTNETYGFRIFKPPTWRSYPQLIRPRTPLVAALGTPDESTLLLIGRESYNGTLDDYARGAERLLRQFYEDYRPQGEHPSEVAGLRAIERNFTARDGDRFWTGMAVYIARGRYCYTLLGLTTAGETVPFQQAVLHRVANSLEFLPE
ncbi:MAG TPA: hypothetical protein VLB32_01465 [Candidatus Acidoferrales bacterium]|nr:hypothetical protein [Candidatus Acidoferrales bacterium]